jgi:monothiol glutaredoxin
MTIREVIEKQIKENNIVLYMKGTADMPMCGFSARAVNLLKSCGVTFTTIDVLQDEAIREGIKKYSEWPTIPQLYVKGEFIGGSDILGEMFEAGELQALVAIN